MNILGYIVIITKSGVHAFRYLLNKITCYFGRFEYQHGFLSQRELRTPSETKNKEVIPTPSRSTSVLGPDVTENNKSREKRRRVSFGAPLRPELFDGNLPPNTPLEKGESPETSKTASTTWVPRKSIMKQTHSKPPEKEPSPSVVEGIPPCTKDPHQQLPAIPNKKSAPSRDNITLSKFVEERTTSIPEIQTIQPHKTLSTPSVWRRSSSARRSQVLDALQTIDSNRGAPKDNLMGI
uniref:Cell division cycle-associated protein 2-like n=1 Tax=Phascolarctos cinereus TaxID=38626 RepID=A0A6P5JWD2_PHACI|nr:cell division cycle-associated protein 2-like [Phascolarctos cinereus]